MNEENNIPNIWNRIAERALRTGANIPIVEEEFDREKALLGLANNVDFNRKQKPATIENFCKLIADGTFAIGSMIRIARNERGQWVLVDGQHRLMAVIKANARVWLMVVADERPASIAYASIDNVGTLRTSGDALSSMLGWSTKRWNAVCASAAIIAGNFSRRIITHATFEEKASKTKRTALVADAMNKFKNEIFALANLTHKDANIFRSSALAVHIVAAHYAPDVFWPYFNSVLADDMLAKNSPEKKLTETFHLSGIRHFEKFFLFQYTVACWNAKFEGKTIERFPRVVLTENMATPIFKIAGTPYPKENE